VSYKENPKTKGSGIIACIPQTGTCPNKCKDCFFQSGRSFLEPLDENLPNIPSFSEAEDRIVRINDGNDSNCKREIVIERTANFKHKFFNTAIPKNLDTFPGPVVVTVNPAEKTDSGWHKIDPIPQNLMMVRVRVNMWNSVLVDEIIHYYTNNEIPVILTFMAYYNKLSIPVDYSRDYMFRKRTLNSYYAITTKAWEAIMSQYKI